MSDATIETVASALKEMASGFEHMCQRMDEMLDKWEASANRQLEILQMQNAQRDALLALSDRVIVIELALKLRRKSRAKRKAA